MNRRTYLIVFSFIIFFPVTAFAMTDVQLIEFRNVGDYIAFENKMKSQLSLPITPVNYETGQPEPKKQWTTDYTRPIFHPNKTDTRILVNIDTHADKRGQTVIDKTEATQKGWDLESVR